MLSPPLQANIQDTIPPEVEKYISNGSLHNKFFYKVQVYGAAIEELQQTVSMKYEEAPRKVVLREIARQGNLGIVLDVDQPQMKSAISMVLEDVTVEESLKLTLAGTSYEAAVTRMREIILLEKEEALSPKPLNSQPEQPEEQRYGSITGKVSDAATGEILPGASLVIKGTTQGTTTDFDGRFLLRRVPVGEQVLVIRYLGYETREVPVTIVADVRALLDVKLEEVLLRGEDIIVTAHQRGQARSLTRQRESVNIRNVIASEQIDAFAVEDVSSALNRVVGMGHGGANVRGIGAGASNITMDGQRMGTTGQDRSVDLSSISIDMVEELNVIKVITPDMDADALSGVIDVSTRRPIGGDRSMNIRLGGGAQDRYFRHTGGRARASFSYGDSPNDRFTYGVNFSYQRDPQARESVGTNWEGRTFEEGRVDVLRDLRTEFRVDTRHRYAGGFQMTFQPTDGSTYHVQSMLNYQDREISQHGLRYNIRTLEYASADKIGLDDAPVRRIDYQPQLDDFETHQYTVQFRGRHLLEAFDMEYVLGWGHSRNNENSYTLQLRTRDEEEITYDLTESNIFMSATNEQGMDHRVNRHLDNEFTGRLDLETPLSRGKIKFGTSALFTFKSGEGERFQSTYDRRLQVGDFQLIPNAEWRVFDRQHKFYQIPWMIDLQKARDLYYGQRPHFSPDLDLWALEMETTQYNVEEHTISGYAMGDIKFGSFTLLGGLRLEQSINIYDGREGAVSEEGRFLGASDVSSFNHYLNIFPNAQTVYALSNMTNIRAAYSRSIGRPNFNQLSPNIMRNYSNQTIRQGNPDLNPMLSHNFDFIIDHYFLNVGEVSVGFFYKKLSDFIFSHTERIRSASDDDNGEQNGNEENPEFEGWERTTFMNGREAEVLGLELSWQQNLTFLPSFLGNLGIYANYAFTQSFADIARRDPDPATPDTVRVPLIDQRPHVLNLGLSYNQGRFSSQVSYHWSAPSISSYGPQQWVPQVHQRHREYFDSFRDAANDLSLTVRFRISPNFRIWADASNILNNKSRDYFFNRDFYPSRERLRGQKFNMGLRYTF